MMSTASRAHATEARKTEATQDNNEATLKEKQLERISQHMRQVLELLGEDPDRQGLIKTPERYARAFLDLTDGYTQSVDKVVNGAIFDIDNASNEMVIVRDIEISSLCEHHMLPFYGKIHIGYIPNKRVLGLSKLARIADIFARRLQVQERLTAQIVDAVQRVLEPFGVAVVAECSHMCMEMRGVRKPGATTLTQSFSGVFCGSAKHQAQFWALLGAGDGVGALGPKTLGWGGNGWVGDSMEKGDELLDGCE